MNYNVYYNVVFGPCREALLGFRAGRPAALTGFIPECPGMLTVLKGLINLRYPQTAFPRNNRLKAIAKRKQINWNAKPSDTTTELQTDILLSYKYRFKDSKIQR